MAQAFTHSGRPFVLLLFNACLPQAIKPLEALLSGFRFPGSASYYRKALARRNKEDKLSVWPLFDYRIGVYVITIATW